MSLLQEEIDRNIFAAELIFLLQRLADQEDISNITNISDDYENSTDEEVQDWFEGLDIEDVITYDRDDDNGQDRLLLELGDNISLDCEYE